MKLPYLKPACRLLDTEMLTLAYRGRRYPFETLRTADVRAVVEAMNGRRMSAELARGSALVTSEVDSVIDALADGPLLLDGAEFVLGDLLSGQEAYWRLEAQLLHWRAEGRAVEGRPATPLDVEVGAGRAPVEVVKGFCLEICHQVSNAPTEIAIAIGNAPTPAVRDLYREFYEEEHAHGGMLREALSAWLPEAGIAAAVPLPETAGLLATYNWWAQSDPLLYAVALIRDEGSGLDAPAEPDVNVYHAMSRHYDVPEQVTERFSWHANLDVDLDHGSFPLEVFSEFPVIDWARYARLTKAARTISELYNAVMASILDTYSANSVESRWSAETVNALAR